MPKPLAQSEFTPSEQSSFVIQESDTPLDYSTLLVSNRRDNLVSIFQGSSQKQQIAVIQPNTPLYKVQIPVGPKRLVFYLHKKSGEVDFSKMILTEDLVFNKGEEKHVAIYKETIIKTAQIKFLNLSAQNVTIYIKESKTPLYNSGCRCIVFDKQSSTDSTIFPPKKYYSDQFFFSVIDSDTGTILKKSQPFVLNRKTRLRFEFDKNHKLTKKDLWE